MYLVGLCLVPLWLLVALVILLVDGRLGLFCILAVPSSVVVLVVVALIRDQHKPAIADADRYRIADDLRRPLIDVVTEAEAAARLPTYRLGGGLKHWE